MDQTFDCIQSEGEFNNDITWDQSIIAAQTKFINKIEDMTCS